jgi:hypothetical protein
MAPQPGPVVVGMGMKMREVSRDDNIARIADNMKPSEGQITDKGDIGIRVAPEIKLLIEAAGDDVPTKPFFTILLHYDDERLSVARFAYLVDDVFYPTSAALMMAKISQ